MKCVSYTRAIPWLENDKILSIDEQNEIIHNYLKGKKGYTLIKKYTDRKRDKEAETAFQDLIAAGMRKEFDCIIVAKIEYLGVSCRELYHSIYKELYAKGIAFICVNESFDSSEYNKDEVERFIRQKWLNGHGARIKNCYKNRRLQSKEYHKYATYGYVLNDENHLQKDEEVSPILDELFSRVKSGERLNIIARSFNNREIKTPSQYLYNHGIISKSRIKRSWTPRIIYGLVCDRTYIGEFKNDVQCVDIADYEPYISISEFEDMTVLLNNEYGEKKPTEQKYYALFFKQMFCKECGKPVWICVYEQNGEKILRSKTFCKHWKERNECDVTESKLLIEVLQKLKEEIHLAKIAKRHIEFDMYGECKAEQYNRLSAKMSGVLSDMRKTVPPLIPYYEKAKSGEISQDEYRQRREEYFAWLQSYEVLFNSVMKEMEDLDIVYSERNPWIKLFSAVDDNVENLKTYKRYVKRIDISLPHEAGKKLNIDVTFKKDEWKERLSKSMFEEL